MSPFSIVQYAGLLMMLVAHLFMKVAPPDGPARFPYGQVPWENRQWFSPLGYFMQLIGWGLFMGGFFVKIFLWVK